MNYYNPYDQQNIRIYHACPAAQGIDIYLNEKPFVKGLGYQMMTHSLPIPQGMYTMKVCPSMGNEILAQGNINIDSSKMITVAPVETKEKAQIIMVDDMDNPKTGSMMFGSGMPGMGSGSGSMISGSGLPGMGSGSGSMVSGSGMPGMGSGSGSMIPGSGLPGIGSGSGSMVPGSGLPGIGSGMPGIGSGSMMYGSGMPGVCPGSMMYGPGMPGMGSGSMMYGSGRPDMDSMMYGSGMPFMGNEEEHEFEPMEQFGMGFPMYGYEGMETRDGKAGPARVRFIHFSPDTPNVDVVLPDGTVLFSNIGYKGVTDYIDIVPGVYTLQIRPAGTETVALTVPNFTVRPRDILTIYAIGLLNGTPALEAFVLRDNR